MKMFFTQISIQASYPPDFFIWALGVAWYPCGFGSHRLEFKSQGAHINHS